MEEEDRQGLAVEAEKDVCEGALVWSGLKLAYKCSRCWSRTVGLILLLSRKHPLWESRTCLN